MFNGVKNQFLAKMQVEKFLSVQYVRFIENVEKLLENEVLTKEDCLKEIWVIKEQIIKQYNLSDKDIKNEK